LKRGKKTTEHVVMPN